MCIRDRVLHTGVQACRLGIEDAELPRQRLIFHTVDAGDHIVHKVGLTAVDELEVRVFLVDVIRGQHGLRVALTLSLIHILASVTLRAARRDILTTAFLACCRATAGLLNRRSSSTGILSSCSSSLLSGTVKMCIRDRCKTASAAFTDTIYIIHPFAEAVNANRCKRIMNAKSLPAQNRQRG